MKDGTAEVSVNIPIAVFLQRMCLSTWKGQKCLATRTRNFQGLQLVRRKSTIRMEVAHQY